MYELSDEQRMVRRYLDRYRNYLVRKKNLTKMLKDIKDDFEASAFHAVAQGTGGGSRSSKTSSEIPTYILQVLDTERKIKKQIEAAGFALKEIKDVIDRLPDDGDEKVVLEAKYISRMSEYDICDMIPCSRRTYFRIVDTAVEHIIGMPDVMEKIRLALNGT